MARPVHRVVAAAPDPAAAPEPYGGADRPRLPGLRPRHGSPHARPGPRRGRAGELCPRASRPDPRRAIPLLRRRLLRAPTGARGCDGATVPRSDARPRPGAAGHGAQHLRPASSHELAPESGERPSAGWRTGRGLLGRVPGDGGGRVVDHPVGSGARCAGPPARPGPASRHVAVSRDGQDDARAPVRPADRRPRRADRAWLFPARRGPGGTVPAYRVGSRFPVPLQRLRASWRGYRGHDQRAPAT